MRKMGTRTSLCPEGMPLRHELLKGKILSMNHWLIKRKLYISTLRLKLGLMINFVKAMNQNGQVFFVFEKKVDKLNQ